jgi:uncharacterized protein
LKLLGYIFFLLVIAFSQPVFAQLRVQTFYDKENSLPKEIYYITDSTSQILTGSFISYYFNGKVNTIGQYENNEAVGLWRYYYENGNIKMEGPMQRNHPYGIWKYYYENGRVSQEGRILKDQKEGEWVYYFENGRIKSRGKFKDNLKEGLWNYSYEDGEPKAQILYENGSGHYQEFYPSGKIKMEGMIKNGLSDGIWTYYYESGIKQAEGVNSLGERQGIWRFYYPNRILSAEGNYEAGHKDGKWAYYHENGELSSEGVERGGLKDGYWKLYNRDGSLKGESNLVNGSGDYTEYWENGKIKIKGHIKNNLNSGKWTYYYEDGKVEGEAHFVEGEGEYIGFYKDGSIKMKGRIKNGKNIGVWELYEKKGSLAGYYRPYYEDDKPVYKIISDEMSMNPDSIGDYVKPDYKFRNRQIKYFVPRVNEFRGFIFSANPVAPTLGSLPIAVEYYLQERLGHELQYTMIRDPFLTSNKNIPIGDIYKRGFAFALKQKFYHPDENFGMFYFGHEVRFTSISHMTNMGLTDPTSDLNLRTITVDENKIEYSLLIGNRWMKFFGERWMSEESKTGVTIDVFGGVGVGYRYFKQDTFVKNDYHVFDALNRRRLTLPIRLGITIGYVF